MKFKKWLLIVPACLIIAQAKPMDQTNQNNNMDNHVTKILQGFVGLCKKFSNIVKKECAPNVQEKLEKKLALTRKKIKSTRKLIKKAKNSPSKKNAQKRIRILREDILDLKITRDALKIKLDALKDTEEEEIDEESDAEDD